ncbi:MAG: putative Fe-S cluster assembly protein SufT [Planctomycetes bacterium]|nr:putative Fe-S cluster assembly protein SufT [Planctomycetota bacterium]
MYEEITLAREVDAVQIPYGDKLKLPAGSRITVHQVLGGNFTVLTDQGMMVRIDSKDAEALGDFGVKAREQAQKQLASQPALEIPPDTPADQAEILKKVWEALRTCYDPEIPVNIVELGLIYELRIDRLPAGGFGVELKMSLTAPGCGMGPILADDARQKLLAVSGVKAADVEVVFDPPWDPSRMSEAARLQLGMM